MKIHALISMALLSPVALATIPTPERALSNPLSIVSPPLREAAPIPIADLASSRTYRDAAWSPDGRTIFLVINLSGRFNIWRTDTAGSWPQQLVSSEQAQTDLAPSPDGRMLLYAQDTDGNEYHDIYSVPTAGGAIRQLTNTPDISESTPVFSPDGRFVAIRHRRKGASGINIALLDIETGSVEVLTTEDDSGLVWSIVNWTSDGSSLIVNRGDSAQTHSSVWRIRIPSGATEELIEIAGARVVASDISADGRTLALSTNRGQEQMRAGMLDLETRTYRWLPQTPWEQFAGRYSPDGKSLVVRTNVDGRTTLSLVDVATASSRPLGATNGVNLEAARNTRSFAPDSRQLLIQRMASDTPGEIVLVDAHSGTQRPLTRLAVASLNQTRLPKAQIVTYRSFDETLISGVLTVPFNLERNGSHPAVVLAHGGPTAQTKDTFVPLATALASRGYWVIRPNFRGSTGYGRAFQQANVHDLGNGDLQDVLAAKDFLVATGYVDPHKVAIGGASYGGFLTLMALGKTPEVFAAGVQWFGITNWHTMWEASDTYLREYQRQLLGHPVQDAARYKALSPLTYLHQATAPLLTLQGAQDVRVPVAQAQQVSEVLQANAVLSSTVIYPDEGHGFHRTENQVDALARTVAWFETHLRGQR